MLGANTHISSQIEVQAFAFTAITTPVAQSATALLAMGFTAFRKHRSKQITLFKSADAYLLLHETAAVTDAAFGIIVPHVDAFLRRAANIDGIEVHHSGPVGPLALHIPALRIGGTHISIS